MNNVIKIFVILILLGLLSQNDSSASVTAKCGGYSSSSLIRPNASNVNVLMIYTYFPSGGTAGTNNIPNFASDVAQHQSDYYDEMSYNTHHLNVQVIQRPAPNNGKAFLANNSLSYYQSGFGSNTKLTELNNEILDKAWAEDNTVFNNVDAVFIFYGGNVFNPTGRGSTVAILSHYSSHYSGCGALMEWGYWGSDEEKVHKWHLAHEYGHLLSTDGTTSRRLWDQYTQPGGIYNIMYYMHVNVTQPMAAFNLIYLGWIQSSWIKEIDPVESGDQSQTVTIQDTRTVPSSGNYNVVRIKIPGTTNEHFIVENRQGTGSDQFLSGNGLVIWHLNKSYSTYNYNGGIDVEIATPIGANGQDWLDDGVQGGEGPGFAADFFNSTNKSEFTPWTNPSTESGFLYSGSHSFTNLAFRDIYKSGSTMIFDFLENAPPAALQNLVITNAGQNGQYPILSWDANTEPDLDHYNIYRKMGSSNWSFVTNTTNTYWTDLLVIIDTSGPLMFH